MVLLLSLSFFLFFFRSLLNQCQNTRHLGRHIEYTSHIVTTYVQSYAPHSKDSQHSMSTRVMSYTVYMYTECWATASMCVYAHINLWTSKTTVARISKSMLALLYRCCRCPFSLDDFTIRIQISFCVSHSSSEVICVR